MHSKFFGICTLLALLPTLGCSEVSAPPSGMHSDNAQAVRILPLGDSITQADSKHQSYRPWLWQLLNDANVAVDFVGSLDSNYKGSPAFPDNFDLNHEGHWGWRSDEILRELPQWLQHYDADISLIHLGTNDCLQKQPVAETLDELTQIVSLLRQDNPEISIAFSTLGPTTWENQECLKQINQGLIALQKNLDTPQSSITIAPTDQNLRPQPHLYDGLHPNSDGEKVIALAWFNAIKSWLPVK